MLSSKEIGDPHHEITAEGGEEGLRMLIVDDNEMIRTTLRDFFEEAGFSITLAVDGEEALDFMRQSPSFDVVLLDVMLPKKNGFDVLRESQEQGLLSPVLMLSGRGEQENVLKGFGLGAADYVVKPFDPDDLAARVRAIVGRGQTGREPVQTYRFGDVEVDFRTNQAWRKGEVLDLSELELDVLRYLIQHRGQVVTLKRLMREALTIDADTMMFSVDHDTMMRTIEQHVAELRRKIELNPSNPKYLETVYGLGYRFNG